MPSELLNCGAAAKRLTPQLRAWVEAQADRVNPRYLAVLAGLDPEGQGPWVAKGLVPFVKRGGEHLYAALPVLQRLGQYAAAALPDLKTVENYRVRAVVAGIEADLASARDNRKGL